MDDLGSRSGVLKLLPVVVDRSEHIMYSDKTTCNGRPDIQVQESGHPCLPIAHIILSDTAG